MKDNKFAETVSKNLLNEDIIAFDTETYSKADFKKSALLVRSDNKDLKVVSIIISTREDSYYIPINHKFYEHNFKEERVKELFQPLFNKSNLQIIAHNYNFDRHVLKRLGISIESDNIFDTLAASKMINQNDSNKLEKCIERYLGVEGLMEFDDVVATVPKEVKQKVGMATNSKAGINLVDVKIAARYGIEDTEYLIPLYEVLKEKLNEEGLDYIYYRYIIPFGDVLYKMEKTGVNINNKELDRMSIEMGKDIEQLEEEMKELIGFEVNYNSPIQLAELLYNEYSSDPPCDKCKEDECHREDCEAYEIWDKYGHKNPNIFIRENSFNFPVPERTDTDNPSAGKDALNRFKHYTPKNERQEQGIKFIEKLLEFKKIDKLKSTFVDGLKQVLYDDGKAHGAFNLLGAKSGRLSSSQPNLQNLSGSEEDDKYKIRKMFIPENKNNLFLASDYTNLEMKLLAEFSKDDKLLEMFREGYDIHGATAKNMIPYVDCHPNEAKKEFPLERTIGKVLNFMINYGGSVRTLYFKLMDFGVDLESEKVKDTFNCYNGMEVARLLYNNYFETFSGVDNFIKEQKKRARKDGYITNILGRKLFLKYINSSDHKKRAYSERYAVNGVMQSSGSSIMMCSQLRMMNDRRLQDMNVKQILQVHDESVSSFPKQYKKEVPLIVKELMEDPFEGRIETEVKFTVDYDIGESYYSAK